ncbi:MAG: hypothetical protein ACP5GR_04370 [Thermoplasmata archaeon]
MIFHIKKCIENKLFHSDRESERCMVRRPIPALKASTYELRQIYTLKYEL